MIKILNLTLKNFLSTGNVSQAVNLDRNDLTLIIGANMDMGGRDSGSGNGSGKSSLLNAISYALFGQALSNIKKDNLINRTNSKGMFVSVEFEKGGLVYRIERGRKPNILKFYISGVEKESKDDNSQGDSRETQAEIERVLQMSHNMFTHIVALNTYTDPFLKLKANEQRQIIEQLLGITLLSEKAENLKNQIKSTKDSISYEESRIKAVSDANKRIQDQIDNLKQKQDHWDKNHKSTISELTENLKKLTLLDIDLELKNHKLLAEWFKLAADIKDLATEKTRFEKDISKENKIIENFSAELSLLLDHKCHSCGQEIHDDKHNEMLIIKKYELENHTKELSSLTTTCSEINLALESLGVLSEKPTTFYPAERDAVKHQSKISEIQTSIAAKRKEINPYSDQIKDMETHALEEISFNKINDLTNLKEHQEFLLKLLTSKDSFIRKRIIDQNLSYLNTQLTYYLDQSGLPHRVVFQNDLTVSITELGRDLDFHNLSRGEMTRVILALSFAFRDVWENLYEPINLMFVDELVDNGLDSGGVENTLQLLKKMSRDQNKSVWLVSHRDELINRVNNILTVTKSNGFTTYSADLP